MKEFLTTLALLVTFVSFSQNYQPFNEASSKRFFDADAPADDDYFFHLDSSTISGDSTLLYQYHNIQIVDISTIDPTGCSFWGGPTGEVLDTTWLGNMLNWNSTTNELRVRNEQNELLSFDFGMNLGGSSQFYSNGSVNYFIELNTAQIETFFGLSDSVKTYSISATNTGGATISTSLDGFELKLSKNYGLLSFINTYDFPSQEQKVELKGQTNPLIGSYQLTYEESYPWQINDIVQYESSHAWGGFPTPPPSHVFQTLTVIDRIETSDSVKLYLSSVVQENNPPTPVTPFTIGAAEIFFKKGECISDIPWNGAQSMNYFETAKEDSTEHCGYYENFITQEYFSTYCDSCHCIGSADGFGQSVEYAEYVKGYGLFRKYPTGYGAIGSIPSMNAVMIYSNINGVECGTFWNSVDELSSFNWSVSPNPANDFLTVISDQPIDQIKIIDLSGRTVEIVQSEHTFEQEISLVSLRKGSYILELTSEGVTQTKKFIRE
ncbi:MAG: T9SS type A sorting domain-containing protein [Crocinitomicaceae bacterium]